jgi:hypothetical protein
MNHIALNIFNALAKEYRLVRFSFSASGGFFIHFFMLVNSVTDITFDKFTKAALTFVWKNYDRCLRLYTCNIFSHVEHHYEESKKKGGDCEMMRKVGLFMAKRRCKRRRDGQVG